MSNHFSKKNGLPQYKPDGNKKNYKVFFQTRLWLTSNALSITTFLSLVHHNLPLSKCAHTM